MDTFSAVLQAAGLSAFLPLVLALHATASALDALLPQPAPGSHWIVPRKLLSVAAMNVMNASNAAQPPMITWVQRIASVLVGLLPPQATTSAVSRAYPIGPAVQPPAAAPTMPPPLFPTAAPPQS